MSSIRAVRAGGNVGLVTRFWVPRGVATRQRSDCGGCRRHESGVAQMATFAVGVERSRGVVSIVGGRDDLAAGLMLVLMVAEVLPGRYTGLVRAVGRCRRPDQLERHHQEQDREQPTMHPAILDRLRLHRETWPARSAERFGTAPGAVRRVSSMSDSGSTAEPSAAGVLTTALRHWIFRVPQEQRAPQGLRSPVRNTQWQLPQQEPADLVGEFDPPFTGTGV